MPLVGQTVGQCAAVLARSGANGAGALIEKLQRGEVWGATGGLALFHAMSGEFDLAAEYAARAIDERDALLVKYLRPLMASSSMWPALARRMNLP